MIRITSCLAALLLLLSACESETGPEPGAADSAEALFPVRASGNWGYIDRSGTLAIEPQFDRAWRFSGGFALVEDDGGFGFIRRDGSVAIDPQFDDAWHFSDGLAPVEVDGNWAYVDTTGRVVADTQFNVRTSTFLEAAYDEPPLQLVSSGGQYGFRSESGQGIDPRFEKAWRFSDGLARVKTGGKWGYITEDGEFAIEPKFDRAWDFIEGLAMVQVGDKMAYIDREGRYVWPPNW